MEGSKDLLKFPEEHLHKLAESFAEAMVHRSKGENQQATEILFDIISEEPRLAEPRIELAQLSVANGDLDDAEIHILEAISILEKGGQWLENISENAMLSNAFDTLGVVYQTKSESDEVLFGPPDEWRGMLKQAAAAFLRASNIDPTNTDARFRADSILQSDK